MAIIGGCALNHVCADAITAMTHIAGCAGVAVVAGCAVRDGGIGAPAGLRIALARCVTLILRGALYRLGANALALVTDISSRTGVAVIT